MAKKPAKKTRKSSAGMRTEGPLAVLYNLDAGTPRGDAARAVLAQRGIRVKTVALDRLNDPVGALVGLPGFKPTKRPLEGEAPNCEFMLLHNVSSSKLNELLPAMREANCTIGCKAQVTQSNRLWPFVTLVREVSREHELMTSQRTELVNELSVDAAADPGLGG